jgi:hypothetical protein
MPPPWKWKKEEKGNVVRFKVGFSESNRYLFSLIIISWEMSHVEIVLFWSIRKLVLIAFSTVTHTRTHICFSRHVEGS